VPKLTPALIAGTALELGDCEGAAAMSMRRIAAGLGCDPMAIYRHFPNREALLDAVADLALADVTDPGPETAWDRRITAILGTVRATALRHPGISAALGEAGLSPVAVVQASQALIAYVAAALAMAVDAGVRDDRWHQVSGAMIGLPGEAMPVVGSEEQFAYGLRLLLHGVRAEAGR
jgi:AcrR family transcriptional regulator